LAAKKIMNSLVCTTPWLYRRRQDFGRYRSCAPYRWSTSTSVVGDRWSTLSSVISTVGLYWELVVCTTVTSLCVATWFDVVFINNGRHLGTQKNLVKGRCCPGTADILGIFAYPNVMGLHYVSPQACWLYLYHRSASGRLC